jgi:hypothetical protein
VPSTYLLASLRQKLRAGDNRFNQAAKPMVIGSQSLPHAVNEGIVGGQKRRKPLHFVVCENACASSPTSPLHVLLIETRLLSCPRARVHFASATLQCVSFRRSTTHRLRICSSTSEPARLLVSILEYEAPLGTSRMLSLRPVVGSTVNSREGSWETWYPSMM